MKNLILIIFGILLFLFVGCDAQNNKKAEATKHSNKKLIEDVKEKVIEKREKKTEKPALQKTDAALSKVIKEMDDFSAALGLQYARFSYDTNRYLIDYTNVIVKLTDEEFLDFLNDFYKARRNMNKEELLCLRNLIRDKLNALNLTIAYFDLTRNLFDHLICTYDISELPLKFNELRVDMGNVLNKVKESKIEDNDKARLELELLNNCFAAYGAIIEDCDGNKDNIFKAVEEIKIEDYYTDSQKCLIECEKLFLRALNNQELFNSEMPDLLEKTIIDKNNEYYIRYLSIKFSSEAYAKGKKGREAGKYVMEKLKETYKGK